MFLSYHMPSYLYGTDTMTINLANIERLELKYRKTLKCMLSLPDCTSSPVVYLCIGILPNSAQRDVEILGLFGQLVMCHSNNQNIRRIIEHTLTFYGVNFPGWSGLVRRTCLQYSLPDPLQYLHQPWRPDRWRAYCKKTVQHYWGKKLLHAVVETPSLKYVDTESASLSIPMRGWQLAGLCSTSVRHNTVVNWMLLGVYFTREKLYKMKKAKSPYCLGCGETEKEDLPHILLQCVHYKSIREVFIPKFVLMNTRSCDIMND